MKHIILALVLVASLVFATAPPTGASQGKWAIGTLHGSSACTVKLGGFLFGANQARFFFQGDTIVNTLSYYHTDVQFQPFAGSAWSASVALVSDSITLNHEATATTAQYSTDTLPTGTVWRQNYGTYSYARLIFTPTVLAAVQGIKNCTLWVVRYKE